MTKIMISVLILCTTGPLADLGAFLFGPFKGHRDAELVFVMIVCPFFMNGIQFWVSE